MRRLVVLALVMTLSMATLGGAEAAKKKKKKKPPQPVATTLYLHGTQRFGEAEIPDAVDGNLAIRPLDTQEPSESDSKSMFVTNFGPAVRPNPECSGNALVPIFQGDFVGTVEGDVKVTLHTIASPAAIIAVELFADAAGGCNDSFVPPVAATTVPVAAGQGVTEVVLEGVDFTTQGTLLLQIRAEDTPARLAQTRIFYDSTSASSMIELSCIPVGGATTCAPAAEE